jgi:hypothetical protein
LAASRRAWHATGLPRPAFAAMLRLLVCMQDTEHYIISSCSRDILKGCRRIQYLKQVEKDQKNRFFGHQEAVFAQPVFCTYVFVYTWEDAMPGSTHV